MSDVINAYQANEKPLSPIVMRLSRALFKLQGWTLVGEIPYSKAVYVCAPHTSNWDVWFWLLAAWSFGIRPHWMGKHTLFKWPLGILIRWTGGVPTDRSGNNNVVDQIAGIFNRHDVFMLGVATEGTRKYTDHWKSGFYYMALKANVPIVLSFLDYPTKSGGIGPCFMPSGDVDKDMEIIRAFYADKIPKYPQNKSEVRLLPRNEHPTNGNGAKQSEAHDPALKK